MCIPLKAVNRIFISTIPSRIIVYRYHNQRLAEQRFLRKRRSSEVRVPTTKKRRRKRYIACDGVVRVTGLEPARRCHWNLNPTCLPIPPYPRIASFYHRAAENARKTGIQMGIIQPDKNEKNLDIDVTSCPILFLQDPETNTGGQKYEAIHPK